MRWGSYFILTAMLAGGCAAPTAQVSSRASSAATNQVYDTAVAAVLVFDPPIVADSAPVDLGREGRGPAAYAGFEDTIYSYYYLYQSDSQIGYGLGWGSRSGWYGNGGNYDRFERTAVTQRVGVSYR